MPIEIRELNIRINVNSNQPEQDPSSTQAGNNSEGAQGKEEIIAECIEQVMEMLRNKNER